jgi:DNA-binding NarL/FixJ family response regulator
MSLFEAGEVERGWEIMHSLGSDDLPHKIPVEKCFDWEILGLVEIALGNLEAAESYMVRTEQNAAKLGPLLLPEALALRGRAALLLAQDEPLRAAELALESAAKTEEIGAHLVTAYSRSLAGRALAEAGERERAIAELRRAESELDRFGSHRVRDEMRRELRKLGARAETRGRATAEDSGIEALTKRELEIAALITDRMTNKQIASELFLSEKTIESHIRNIFIKVGASSRVEVARAIERDRREREDVS